MKNKKIGITWQIDLSQLIGKRVSIETHEGHLRTASLTEVRYKTTHIAGYTVETPDGIVLDGDDLISFSQIRFLNLS
jgi:hypothetical protein